MDTILKYYIKPLILESSLKVNLSISIEISGTPSIDKWYEFGQRGYDPDIKSVFHWEKKDEYGVYRDEHGYARAPDRRIIHVSREDIRDILARATMYEAACICLPEQVEKFNRILPNLRSYSRADIDDIVNSIYRSEKMSLDDTYMSLDDIYFPLNDIIEMLTTRMDELKTEMDMIQL